MSFLGSFYKDVKLFLTASGLLALLLPLLLLPALMLGVDDLTAASFVSSFPIAVRDEDDTVMSHSLITQLRDIDLFSEVRVLTDETDAQAVEEGAVAVATIPEDFFYDLYTMSDCPVDVTVNSEFPTQAAIFTSVFRSVMGIINANHASALGTYTFVYGELTPELIRQMRGGTGDRLVYDALGRQRFFADLAVSSDLPAALIRRLSACVLGALAIFFALTSAKTLPEERRLGVLPRLRAAGLGRASFIMSKLLSACLLSMPAVALAALLLKMSFIYVALIYMLLLACAFGIMSALAITVNSAASAQRLGNIILLLSITLGGVLWPSSALPEVLRPLTDLTLPRYALLALEARASGLPAGETLALLWPLVPLGTAPLILAAALRAIPGRGGYGRPDHAGAEKMGGRGLSWLGRGLRLTAFRLRSVTGGPATLTLTLAAALVCGLCAGHLRSPGPVSLRLGVWDRDGTELSRELVEKLKSAEGVDVEEMEGEAGRRALLTGEREGLIIIGEGYARAMASGESTPLSFQSSSSSVSAQAARELAAGAAIAQHRSLEAGSDAAKLLGRPLTGEELQKLREDIDEAAEGLPPLYRLTYTGGAAPADPFAPGPMGLACLAALFTLLTAASYAAAPDARSAMRRLRSIPHGPALGLISDMGALTALGFGVMLAVLIPAGAGAGMLPNALAGALGIAALSLTLTSLTAAEGRVDTLAPIAALMICILGGSFMDISALSPGLRAMTYVSPAAIAALPARTAVPALTAYAAVLLAPAAYKRGCFHIITPTVK